MVDASTKMAHRIKDEQERHIASKNADDLIDECLERLVPILTHRRPVRYMSIPVNYERDDDVYILTRLREVQKRLRMEPNTLAKQYESTKGDDQKATQGPYVPGQERSGYSRMENELTYYPPQYCECVLPVQSEPGSVVCAKCKKPVESEVRVPCPACNGTAYTREDKPCQLCDNTGVLLEKNSE